jgi:hypothetical protein
MSSVSTTAVLLADADVGVAAPRDSAGKMRAKPARPLSHVYFDTSGAAERLFFDTRWRNLADTSRCLWDRTSLPCLSTQKFLRQKSCAEPGRSYPRHSALLSARGSI